MPPALSLSRVAGWFHGGHGSNDGESWTELDRRTDIQWACQTNRRSFEVSSPGYYPRYRISIERVGDPARNKVAIAQVEWLGLEEP
ncbi:MAG: hypothetical protein KF833_16585 [Verrucomicrobiae bacterium]|nr:hypothetical protein [Verrucomicrobiae bacterium]